MTAAAPPPARAARTARGALLLAGLYMAAFWLWAGVAKALFPEAGYEFAARALGGGLPAKAAVVASVVAEVSLGASLLCGAVSRRRGLALSGALLLVFLVLLVVARAQGGGALACGCYAFFATGAASVDRELWINGLHAAALLGVLAWDRAAPGRRAVTRRDPPTGGAS